jgi:hypothetical protein
MASGDRARRSPLACLLVALVLGLGLGGAGHAAASPGAGHAVLTAVGGSGPQAVLDLHSVPRLGEHAGKAAGLAPALVVALLLARWRRSSRVRGVVPPPGRPALGSRAPPRISTPA